DLQGLGVVVEVDGIAIDGELIDVRRHKAPASSTLGVISAYGHPLATRYADSYCARSDHTRRTQPVSGSNPFTAIKEEESPVAAFGPELSNAFANVVKSLHCQSSLSSAS